MRVPEWQKSRDMLLRERRETFSLALRLASSMLRNAMQRPVGTKRGEVFVKPDQTLVSSADQNINRAVLDFIQDQHPTDILVGEELSSKGSPYAVVKWHIDPIDNTNHFLNDNFMQQNPYRWVAVMMSLSIYNQHLMFGVAYPVLNEVYFGCWNEGILLNEMPYEIPSYRKNLLIGLNEHEHVELIKGLTGYPEIRIANVEAHLILKGVADGGWSQFTKLHEHGCLTALARCIPGAVVTDLMGNNHQSGNDPLHSQMAVWSRPRAGLTHDDVLNLAWAAHQQRQLVLRD